MPTVKLGAFNLHYDTVGRAGPPVVLIMGLTVPGRSWRSILPALQAHHRVAYFDHRGVGGSDSPRGPYSMAQMAGDVVGLMDHLGWGQAHVVGLSMGGMVAQHVALNARSRVRSLSLLATHAGGWQARLPQPKGVFHFIQTQLLRDRQAKIAALSSLLFPADFLRTCDRHALQTGLEEDFGDPVPKIVLLAQYAAIQGHYTADKLSRLHDLPTLVVRPGQDILVRPDESDRLARLIPNARLVRFDRCGHALTRQDPQGVAKELLQHFAAAERPA
jgi:pimeloyl-ACP methyl ester carboxylesterase